MFMQSVIASSRSARVFGTLLLAAFLVMPSRRASAQESVAPPSAATDEPARVARLEALAAQERIVTPNSRLVALVPFGVGQFQNRQRAAGTFFLVAESALVVAAAITLPVYVADVNSRSSAYRTNDLAAQSAASSRVDALGAANVCVLGGLALVALIGIIHGEATFVPEKVEVRPRPLPQNAVSIMPAASPEAHGLAFGLVGRF
jgi:hypothetical protein